MCNTDAVKPAPNSWAAVFDEARAEVQGPGHRVRQPDLHRRRGAVPEGTQPELGIENVYELDQEQFDAAIDLLKTQNENIGEYWSDYTKDSAAFATGDSIVGTTWQVIANLLDGDKTPRSRPSSPRRARPDGRTPG